MEDKVKALRDSLYEFRHGNWNLRSPEEMADALHDLLDRVADLIDGLEREGA